MTDQHTQGAVLADRLSRMEDKLESFFTEARKQHTDHTSQLSSLQTSLNHWAARDSEVKQSISGIHNKDQTQQRQIDTVIQDVQHLKGTLRWAMGIAGSAFALAVAGGFQVLANLLVG